MEGDVIVPKITPTFEADRSTWVQGSPTTVLTGTTELHVVRPSSKLDPRYLDYLFSSRPFLESGASEMVGVAGQKRIPDEWLRNFPVPVTDLQRQRKIADYLDIETNHIDTLIEKEHHLIDLLAERVNSIVFDGIRGKLTSSKLTTKHSGIEWLGDIPRHFETPWLGAFHTTQLGKMLNAEAATGSDQYPYIKNTNVRWDHFDLEDLPTMTFNASDRQRCGLRSGDVLVCEGGEVGRSAVWDHDSEIFFQKALHRVRPLGENVPRYLMYCLWAASKLGVFEVEGNQATIVHLTGEKLQEHRFPWPPLEEQWQIVELIDAQRKRIDQITESLQKQMELLIERRQALVTYVVTGRKPVTILAI